MEALNRLDLDVDIIEGSYDLYFDDLPADKPLERATIEVCAHAKRSTKINHFSINDITTSELNVDRIGAEANYLYGAGWTLGAFVHDVVTYSEKAMQDCKASLPEEVQRKPAPESTVYAKSALIVAQPLFVSRGKSVARLAENILDENKALQNVLHPDSIPLLYAVVDINSSRKLFTDPPEIFFATDVQDAFYDPNELTSAAPDFDTGALDEGEWRAMESLYAGLHARSVQAIGETLLRPNVLES